MVSERVEIFSRSYREDAKAVHWECDGSPEFTLEEIERSEDFEREGAQLRRSSDKAERGTDIVLHINEESKEFLEPERLSTILNKFCRFLPIPIFYEDKQINNTTPAWTKKPSELIPEDYQGFYKELYPYNEPPLFWIHLNVDYPFKPDRYTVLPQNQTVVRNTKR